MEEKKRYTAEEALNLQAGAYQKGFNEGYELCKKGQSATGWVKAKDRLPGYETPVKWRLDGIERNKGKVTVIYMANGESPASLSDYEWLDESNEQQIEQKENEAVKMMCWAFSSIREWDKEANQIYMYDGQTFPISELYNEYQKQKNAQ